MRIGGRLGAPYTVADGLPQGSPISQLLWIIYSRELVGETITGQAAKRQLSIGWVDDWTLVVRGETAACVAATSQYRLDQVHGWAATHSAQFDMSKAGCMLLGRHTTEDLAVNLNGQRVPVKREMKILGLTFQQNRQWHVHASTAVGKATRAMSGILHWGNRNWGFSHQAARLLYRAAVLPIVTHAIEAWLPAQGFRGIGGLYRALECLQRTAAIRITGSLRSTPTAALNIEADLLPIKLHCHHLQARACLRWLSLPVTHPLTGVIEQRKARAVQRTPGPIDMCFQAYDLASVTIRRRQPRPSPAERPIQAAVPPSKIEAYLEHAVAEAALPPHTSQIYTDGSGHHGRIGAAAVTQVNGAWVAYTSLMPTGSTVFKAELRGILLALQATNGDAVIWTDSQAACLALSSSAQTDPDVQQVQQMIRQAQGSVSLRYIPGHMGIPGNEEADRCAKLAANTLGPEERITEVATVKRALKYRFLQEWRLEWARTTKGRGLRAINRQPLGTVGKLHRALSRKQSSLLTQLRTNHLATNLYLHKRRLQPTPLCKCQMGVPETLQHILTACPMWRRQRQELATAVGLVRAGSSSHLLNSKTAIPHALRFFAHRFHSEQRSSEVQPE